MVYHTIRNATGLLCGAVQELHRYLAPLIKRDNLLDITILNVMEKDHVTPPIPAERALSLRKKPEPQEEETAALPTPNRPKASEPEGAAHSEELAFIER